MDSPLVARRDSRDAKALGGAGRGAADARRKSADVRRSSRCCKAPLIVLPIVNHDNNQHSSNENLRLQNLFDGIEVYAGVLARLGGYWVPRA